MQWNELFVDDLTSQLKNRLNAAHAPRQRRAREQLCGSIEARLEVATYFEQRLQCLRDEMDAAWDDYRTILNEQHLEQKKALSYKRTAIRITKAVRQLEKSLKKHENFIRAVNTALALGFSLQHRGVDPFEEQATYDDIECDQFLADISTWLDKIHSFCDAVLSGSLTISDATI